MRCSTISGSITGTPPLLRRDLLAEPLLANRRSHARPQNSSVAKKSLALMPDCPRLLERLLGLVARQRAALLTRHRRGGRKAKP
jgi:hypothetical protein